MKKLLLVCFFSGCICVFFVFAQKAHLETEDDMYSISTFSERENRKNRVVKEWNLDSDGKQRWLDHLTVWGEDGLKLEEVEYSVYGQLERVTFEYNAEGKCIRENVYNEKNRLFRIRKYEYNTSGKKKVQYNYNPDGKLYSTKIFEYTNDPAEQTLSDINTLSYAY